MVRMTDRNSSIRFATREDVPQLVALLVTLFELEHEFQPDAKAHQQALIQILAQPELGQIFVAEQQGKVVAMVSLLYSVSTALGGKVAMLEDMVVAPEYRAKGLGGYLLDHAISHALQNGCLRISLLTDSDNASAQAFYKTRDFHLSSMKLFRKQL